MKDFNNKPENNEKYHEYSEIIRDMWRHEDDIANNRLSWFNTTQSLLFGAMALALKEGVVALKPVIVWVGILSCALTLVSLFLGVKAKSELSRWWNDNVGNNYIGPPVVGFYFSYKNKLPYLSPSVLLPLVFLGAWLYVHMCIDPIPK